MSIVYNQGGRGYGGVFYNPAGSNTNTSQVGTNPGLVTSTGGLLGSSGMFLIPYYDFTTLKYYLAQWDPTNFNTEELVYYNFRQENVRVNRDCTTHKIIIQYRNLGVVTFTVNLTVFRKGLTSYKNAKTSKALGSYKTVNETLVLGSTKPDGLIYTVEFDMENHGQRPQVQISRAANAGPLSIISCYVAGHADEDEKL